MRTRRSPDHDAALERRLAQLGDDLAVQRERVRAARPEAPAPRDLTAEPWWDEHTRPAESRRPPPPPPPVPRPLPGAAVRPVPPGRHALRRPGPPRLLGGVGPAQLAVVAVVVAVGLAATCWWLVRGSAHPAADLTAAPARGLVPVSPAAEPVAAATPTGGSASGGPATVTVTVDVAGKVRRPGIVVLDAGSRVVDALRSAGGAKPGVDLTALNLARVLADGEQVVVGGVAPTGAAAAAGAPPSGAPSAPAALVNLNTATEDQLDSLPEVGPVTAASILDWRDQHGGFTSVDELLEVDGIGEVTLDKLAPYVTV